MEFSLENVVVQVLDEIGVFADDLAIDSYRITYEELITSLIVFNSIKASALALNIPESALEHRINRKLKYIFPAKRASAPWGMCLLESVYLRRCNICKKIFPFENFSTVASYGSGLNNKCKTCDVIRSQSYQRANSESIRDSRHKQYLNNKEYYLEKSALRRVKLANAGRTLTLSDKEHKQVLDFYKNTPEGCHVDHIVPIEHPLVCGLHCIANLQYLSARDNLAKSNKFTVSAN